MGEFRKGATVKGLALRGYQGKRLVMARSYTPLEVTGSWHITGPAAVEGDDIREAIHGILENHSEIQSIALMSEESGVVYTIYK